VTAFTGRGLDRVDGMLKVTGGARYAADVPVADVAHGVIVGSTVATGRIATIDGKTAEAAAGVLAVLTFANAPKLPGADSKGPPNDRVLQFLQDDAVHYDGQPVAVVVADSLERAQHAAALVHVTYSAAPVTVSLGDGAGAYKPAKLVRDETDSNRGDFGAAFASAPVKVDETYSTPVQTHNPIELHSTTAVWQGTNRLTVYDATQGVYG